MQHSKLIQEITEFIDENLMENLSLERLAKKVYLSPYHFHRVFLKMTGIPPSEYVRRKRVMGSLGDLMKAEENILVISGKYGFETEDGFCRAFKRYLGITPYEYKKAGFVVCKERKERVKYMYTIEIYNKMKCSIEEKLEIFDTIDELLELSRVSRGQGLLALEKHFDHINDGLFRKAIQMVINGVEADVIRELLLNYSLTGEYVNKEFLKRIVILEGILLIQEGANSHIIIEKLSSFLGEDMIEDVSKRYRRGDPHKEELLEKLIMSREEKAIKSKDTSLLEIPFRKLDIRSLQRLLRDIDEYTLVRALIGTSGEIQTKVLSNLSEELGISILEEAELLESTSIIDIKECQKRVLEILNQLVTEGEINITKGA